MTVGPTAALIVIVVAVVSAVANDTLAQRGPERSSPQPLVPGFGFDTPVDPVPGFGSDGSWTDEITDRDRREAEQVMREFDLNQNGQLDPGEVQRGPWSSNFYQVDVNGDGLVSLSELSLRYARRRRDRETGSARDAVLVGEGSRTPSRGERSSEMTGSDDRALTSGREHQSRAANRSNVADEGIPSRLRQSKLSTSLQPKSYRIKSSYERESFLSGLPQWFKTRDTDLDGQIMMYEYASSWTDELVAEFQGMDLNGDGVIIRRECLMATENGIEPSVRVQYSIRPVAKPAVSGHGVSRHVVPSQSHREQPSHVTPLPTSIPASYAVYARGVLQRYDADRNEVLTSNELAAMPHNPAAADANHDDEITVQELAWWYVRHR